MMMSLSARTAMAVHGIGVFELDGNANVDPNAVEPNDVTPGEDWNLVVPTKDPSSAALAKAFAGENVEALGNDANYFTGGGSKDTNDVSQWKYGGNAVPDKNQITNAYAAAYSSGGKLYIYFGADRYSNDGDSALGFWLFKSTVSLGANGSFNGNHTDGDLFIVSDFSNGGTIGTISVYRWNGGANGSLGSTASATGADCRNATGDHLVCARVNGSSVTDHRAPWPYTPKPNIGTPGTFPLLTFFEGGLDVTALAGPDACFSSFLAETRSSTSTTAQLKDFALAQLNTCDARISINPSGVNPV
ncbi:MAG TPA: hypothetical protein VLA19_32180, partial [Herpetosiphonaceae bacterium]|nr:hypothetical protein [Herpetosiphonaceae bacterium]